MQDKVLIIGLDGATWTVLKPWMDDGSLPNLARLRAGGCWGELLSTIPPLTAPAWSTFLTGKNPGKHGVFHFVALDDDPDVSVDAKAEIVDGRSIKSPILWDIVAHHAPGQRLYDHLPADAAERRGLHPSAGALAAAAQLPDRPGSLHQRETIRPRRR
jgi:predicted AlkP superfamily phosphohydrolase/phosphomutase